MRETARTAAPAEKPEAGGLHPTKAEAVETVGQYLAKAVERIDGELGQGYAAANPTLVAAFLQASAIESAVNAGRIASRETNETLLRLKPRLFG